MIPQKYSVNQHAVSILLAWVESGAIAIPEIQRPFVWDASKVRDLMDSLYKGFPVGYVIAWQNPNVRLKDGTTANGKKILIDGQQRITALRAALLGQEVINKDYDKTRIKIAFHPVEQKFEVQTPIIAKDKAWISDISEVVASSSLLSIMKNYQQMNPGVDEDALFNSLNHLMDIPKKPIGIIDLASDLDIETVTEIFIRINSQGVVLSQADFAMAKIAANESHGGNVLRKAIDYFCNMAINPPFSEHIRKYDRSFAETEYFRQMNWLKDEIDDLYDPSYTDLLRVAFVSEFGRGKMSDLVSLLSGRNFETRDFEEGIVADSFARLSKSVMRFMNETEFKRFIMIIKSAGFISSSMIRSQNALNFAYVVYLKLRGQGEDPAKIERFVARWFVLSILSARYSGSAESVFDYDIRQINSRPFEDFLRDTESAQLSDAYWNVGLPQDLESSSTGSPHFNVFLAALVKSNDKGFLSRDITVGNLISFRGDIHHIFPKSYLKKYDIGRSAYNQIANYVYTQQEINIKVGNKAPNLYFREIIEQCNGGQKRYGSIESWEEFTLNLEAHCIPVEVTDMSVEHYEQFLLERRRLMAGKIKAYYQSL